MKTRIFILLTCLTLLGEYAYSQTPSDSNGRHNGVSGLLPPPLHQWNKFPAWGNVGIGTTNPSENLEVIGNLKVSQIIFTHAFESSTSITGGTLSLSGNGVINGYLGLGVASPTERLDVLGNIKLSGNLSAEGLDVQTLNTNSGVFNTLTVNQNSMFNGLSTFGENVSFSKDALITGRMGIGVSAPSEALEVTGNIKSSEGLFSSTLNTETAQLTSLNVSGNSIFSGMVGIGVASPSEKLHIGGNLKVDNSIFSDAVTTTNLETGVFNATGLSSFGENASFTKDITIGGKLGIGVAAPSESLDINGNLKLTGGIHAATLNVTQGSFDQGLTAGNSSINGTLDVTGQLSAQSLSLADMNATNNVSVGDGLTVTGLSQLQGGATIGGTSTVNDLQVTGTLNAGNIAISEVNTTGNATIGQNLAVTGTAQIGGDLSVTGQLNAQSLSLADMNATNNVSVGNGLTVTGSSQLQGGATIGGTSTVNDLQVTGTLNAGNIAISEVNATGNATIGQNLTVNGAGQIGGDLSVTGQLNANSLSLSNINTSNSVQVGSDLSVDGVSELKGGLSVTGNSTVEGNLQVSGAFNAGNLSIEELNTNGNAAITQNLTVNGSSQVGGDLNVAGVVEAAEFRITGGGPSNFENAVITETLKVGTDKAMPANYKMAVGGNIIATGVDIKIPENWPDYVFTDGYKLLSIEGVKKYIDEHGHLPGMPAAKDMQEKRNYNVGDMDAGLLEKIEELTLYVIQLQQENNEQQKLISTLTEEVNTMKKESDNGK